MIKKYYSILIFIIIIVILIKYITFQGIQVFKYRSNNDFPHFYFGSLVLRLGGNPYDSKMLFQAAHSQGVYRLNPYVYPAFTGLVLFPLTFFNIKTASDIWFFLNHLWLILALILLYNSFKNYSIQENAKENSENKTKTILFFDVIFIIALASFSIPFYRNLSAGQMNTFLLFLYSAIFYFHLKNTKKADIIAGFITGFAALYKISPGILLIYFLLKKRWNSATWMLWASCFFLVITKILYGWDVILDFIPIAKQMGYGKSTWDSYGMTFYKDPYNQSLNSFFHHILVGDKNITPWLNLSANTANLLTVLSSLLIFSSIIAMSLRVGFNSKDKIIIGLDFSLFIFLSLFIPSLMWDHYLIQLWMVYFILFLTLTIIHSSNLRYLNLLKIIFIICAIFINIHIPFTEYNKGIGLLLMSAKLWFALILLIITLTILNMKIKSQI